MKFRLFWDYFYVFEVLNWERKLFSPDYSSDLRSPRLRSCRWRTNSAISDPSHNRNKKNHWHKERSSVGDGRSSSAASERAGRPVAGVWKREISQKSTFADLFHDVKTFIGANNYSKIMKYGIVDTVRWKLTSQTSLMVFRSSVRRRCREGARGRALQNQTLLAESSELSLWS